MFVFGGVGRYRMNKTTLLVPEKYCRSFFGIRTPKLDSILFVLCK